MKKLYLLILTFTFALVFTNEIQAVTSLSNNYTFDSSGVGMQDITFDENYIYTSFAVTDNVIAHNKLDGSEQIEYDYEAAVYATYVDDDHVYIAGDLNVIRIYNKDTGVQSAESVDYGDDIRAMAVDEDYIYVGGLNSNTVQIVSKSTYLETLTTDTYNGDINAIAVDENYIYVGGNNANGLHVYNKNNGNLVYTADAYGGVINDVAVDDNYVYVGGATTETVQVYNKNNGNLVNETASYGGMIEKIAITDNYIIVGGYTAQTIAIYDIETMDLVIESNPITDITGLAVDNQYIYVGEIGGDLYSYTMNLDAQIIDYTINTPYFHYTNVDFDIDIETNGNYNVDLQIYELDANGQRNDLIYENDKDIDGIDSFTYDFNNNADYPYEVVVNGESYRKGYVTPIPHPHFFDRNRNAGIGDVVYNQRILTYQHNPENYTDYVFRTGENPILHLNFDDVLENERIYFYNENITQISPFYIDLAYFDEFVGIDSSFIPLTLNGTLPPFIDDNIEFFYRLFTQNFDYTNDYEVTINSLDTPYYIDEPEAFEYTNGLENADIYIDDELVVENGEGVSSDYNYSGEQYGFDLYVDDDPGDVTGYSIYFIKNPDVDPEAGLPDIGTELNPGAIFAVDSSDTPVSLPFDVRVVLSEPEPVVIEKGVYTYSVDEYPSRIEVLQGESIFVVSDYNQLVTFTPTFETIKEDRLMSMRVSIPDDNFRQLYSDFRLIDGFTNTNYGDQFDYQNPTNIITWRSNDILNLDTAEIHSFLKSNSMNLTQYRFENETEYTIEEVVPINESVDNWFDSAGISTFEKVLIIAGLFIFLTIVLVVLKAPKWAVIFTNVALYFVFTVFGFIPIWLVLVLTIGIIALLFMIFTRAF